ncbi:MAG: cysteine desulfurase [archaeon]
MKHLKNVQRNVIVVNREDFPILDTGIIYFDNACMSLKPNQVINKVMEYYRNYPSCAGRSSHHLSTKLNDEVHKARNNLRKYFNAKSDNQIIFTKNTTESINLVANSFGLKPEDKVLISDKEHNSNLIPWQKQNLVILNSNDDNTFNLDLFKEKVEGIKLVALGHTSNLDGVTIPAKKIIKIAHKAGAKVLLDGAQSAPHKEVNLKSLDADFFACSGHKMLGPTGMGLLYAKEPNQLKPFIVGGETVVDSTYTTHTYEESPMKFEAGLQHYAGILGFGEASQYLKKIIVKVEKQETKLNTILTDELKDHVNIIGPLDPKLRAGIFNFTVDGMDPHEISIMLDTTRKILIRSGAHCVHSWFNKHKIKGSARASLYFYNTEDECMKFVRELKKILVHFK